MREGQITPEEAQVHPQRSIITRALGMEPQIEVDSWQLIPYRGDRILLCSDGLTNEVSDDRIASTLRQIRDPKEAARDLVRQARDHGGNDNITVVIVDVVDDDGRSEAASEALEDEELTALASDRPLSAPTRASDEGPPTAVAVSPPGTAVRAEPPPEPSPAAQRSPRRITWRVVAFLAAFAIVIAVGVLAISWYARSTYYVGLDGDRVAIFKGRPGGFMWFEPTLQERKTLTTSEIFPSRVTELRAGKEEPTKAAADRYVNQIRQEGAARVPTTTTTAPAPTTTVPAPADSAPVPP